TSIIPFVPLPALQGPQQPPLPAAFQARLDASRQLLQQALADSRALTMAEEDEKMRRELEEAEFQREIESRRAAHELSLMKAKRQHQIGLATVQAELSKVRQDFLQHQVAQHLPSSENISWAHHTAYQSGEQTQPSNLMPGSQPSLSTAREPLALTAPPQQATMPFSAQAFDGFKPPVLPDLDSELDEID
ncbi:hypothetical protein P7C71_g6382, partial [Lecanoromycetidae sp. Uapishka_2]